MHCSWKVPSFLNHCQSILPEWVMGFPTGHRWEGRCVWDRDRFLGFLSNKGQRSTCKCFAVHGRCLLSKVPPLLCSLDLKSDCSISGLACYSQCMAVPSWTVLELCLGQRWWKAWFWKIWFWDTYSSVSVTGLICALWTLPSGSIISPVSLSLISLICFCTKHLTLQYRTLTFSNVHAIPASGQGSPT